VAGGNSAEYNNVSFPSAGLPFTLKPDVFTRIAIEEVALGTSYKVNDRLKVGIAWRGAFVQADQDAAATSPGNGAVIAQEYRGMKGQNLMGYRLGLQYDYGEGCGVGISYRNALPVAASGKLFVRANSALGASGQTASDSDMSVKTQLPQQLNLGVHHKFSQDWTGFFDYSWTNYGAIDRLIYEGNYTTSVTGPQPLTDIYVGWSDQHIVRLAGEYTGFSMPIRFGYAYTSQVTSNNFANATFAPPSPSHTLSLGTGWELGHLGLDVAADYTTFKGSVGAGQSFNSLTTKVGNYSANVWAAHLGATYMF
jgi:long-subunit fatty acid transport protein